MPTYEFHCLKCKKVTDTHFSYEDRPKSIVCKCGGKAEYRISAGQIPIINDSSNETLWDKSKTIGEYWDRKNIDFKSEEYKKASRKRVNDMKKKAARKKKNGH